MFTQRHYIKIAEVLKESVSIMTDSEGSFIRSRIVQAFVVMLEKDSKKFDKNKFADAVYGKEVSKSEEK